MKRLLFITVLMMLLSACAPSGVQVRPLPAVDLPANAPGAELTGTPVVKVVEMATQTPMPTKTPIQQTPTTVPPQITPTTIAAAQIKTLAELGIPATTYTDDVARLALDYPAEWEINAVPDEQKQASYVYTASLRSKTGTRGPKFQEGIPADMAAIDLTVFFKDGPKTLEAAINERRSASTTSESGQPVTIVLEEDWELANGLKAHRFLYNIGPEVLGSSGPDRMVSEVVTMINGRMVLVVGMGDLSLFNVVVASLREK
jgi:hypothetical protein